MWGVVVVGGWFRWTNGCVFEPDMPGACLGWSPLRTLAPHPHPFRLQAALPGAYLGQAVSVKVYNPSREEGGYWNPKLCWWQPREQVRRGVVLQGFSCTRGHCFGRCYVLQLSDSPGTPLRTQKCTPCAVCLTQPPITTSLPNLNLHPTPQPQC